MCSVGSRSRRGCHIEWLFCRLQSISFPVVLVCVYVVCAQWMCTLKYPDLDIAPSSLLCFISCVRVFLFAGWANAADVTKGAHLLARGRVLVTSHRIIFATRAATSHSASPAEPHGEQEQPPQQQLRVLLNLPHCEVATCHVRSRWRAGKFSALEVRACFYVGY